MPERKIVIAFFFFSLFWKETEISDGSVLEENSIASVQMASQIFGGFSEAVFL